MAATSLLELVFVSGVAATLGAMALPQARASLEDSRAAGAARYLSARLQETRTDAIVRSRATAMRFSPSSDGYVVGVYADGNRNGVLSREIQSGIDVPGGRPERLVDQFPGVDFGTIPGLPAVDASSVPPGSDPIRLGPSDMVVFTPTGTATAGSVYLRGRANTQYVVRVFGETGKTRILKFDSRTWQWMSLSDL